MPIFNRWSDWFETIASTGNQKRGQWYAPRKLLAPCGCRGSKKHPLIVRFEQGEFRCGAGHLLGGQKKEACTKCGRAVVEL